MLSDYGFVRTAIDVVDTSPAGNLWAPVYSEPTFTYDYILVSTGTAPAYAGSFQGFQAACASVYVDPGHTEGTTAVLRAAQPTEVGGWAQMQYGFSTFADIEAAEMGLVLPVFANCAIAFAPSAGSVVLAPSSKSVIGTVSSCVFGENGSFRP